MYQGSQLCSRLCGFWAKASSKMLFGWREPHNSAAGFWDSEPKLLVNKLVGGIKTHDCPPGSQVSVPQLPARHCSHRPCWSHVLQVACQEAVWSVHMCPPSCWPSKAGCGCQICTSIICTYQLQEFRMKGKIWTLIHKSTGAWQGWSIVLSATGKQIVGGIHNSIHERCRKAWFGWLPALWATGQEQVGKT